MADALNQWEIEIEGGWETFRPGVPFEGKAGEEISFKRGSFQYKAIFENDKVGRQDNLRTGKRRGLRKKMCVHASPPLPGTQNAIESEWVANFQMLRKELVEKYPQLLAENHPAHSFFTRAESAASERRWEVAFNDLFVVQDALTRTGRDCASQSSPQGASSSSTCGIKRSASFNLSEAVGVPVKVARRLLNDAGGDASIAASRALMIQDLEEGNNSQLKTSSKAEECSICVETCGRGEAVMLLPCKHGWYCIDCLRRAADAKIDNGATLGSIGCPACSRKLSEALLRALLDTKQMDRLHRQGLEAAVAACPEIRPCPTPDCPNRVALEDGMTPRLRCELCNKDHCLLCSASPYHVGKSCQEHLADVKGQSSELSLRKWMSKVGAKQCPKCQMIVTKQNLKDQTTQETECHKMICRACRTRFCFGCLAILTPTSSCGCTPDSHGFIDPDTGAFVQHLAPVPRAIPHRRVAPRRR